MPFADSPLRYPGGKSALTPFFADVLRMNGLLDGVYVEPFAGGAGVGLALLYSELVGRVILNDADPCIYAFWQVILKRTDAFLNLLREVPVTIDEWRRQRAIYRSPKAHSQIRVALATFYLNRCNRSGIIVNGGPVGGWKQDGLWRLDARFHKDDLADRIERISLYRDRITMHNLDALDFLRRVVKSTCDLDHTLVYLDPPYYAKGKELYLNHYSHEDHAELARYVKRQGRLKWVLTYDDVPQVHSLYPSRAKKQFSLAYSASGRKRGREILIWADGVGVPDSLPGDHGP